MIGDIGGGRGHLLRSILDGVPAARGVLWKCSAAISGSGNKGSSRRIKAYTCIKLAS
jgi:hypothetical protein